MENQTVALAAIGLAGTVIGLMVWVVKKVIGEIAPALEKHSKSAISLGHAVEKNTQSNEAMITFMTKLNGK